MPADVALLTVPMALGVGLIFGAGPCNITCLPFMAPVFIASHHTPAQSWKSMGWFSAGRLTSYTLCGLIAGALGQLIEDLLKHPSVGWVLGVATILVGLNLLWRKRQKRCANACSKPKGTAVMPSGLFLMGLGMALNPCAPLSAVLLAASVSGSALNGGLLGLSFGLGAVLLPSLIFSVGVAHFGRELRHHLAAWMPRLEWVSACLLITLGVVTVTGGIRV